MQECSKSGEVEKIPEGAADPPQGLSGKIAGQGGNARASPGDLSSSNPSRADPLLQARQISPQPAESQPDSAEKMDTEAAVDGGGVPDRERRAGREQGRVVEEEDGEGDEAAGGETADEGLPLSKGGDDVAEQESERLKEPPDANNNSMETPQNCQENFITIPEITEQVSVERRASAAF